MGRLCPYIGGTAAASLKNEIYVDYTLSAATSFINIKP